MLIHDLLFDLCKDRSMIAVTHRLEYLSRYDNIILLENGQIADQGNYKELAQDCHQKILQFIRQQ